MAASSSSSSSTRPLSSLYDRPSSFSSSPSSSSPGLDSVNVTLLPSNNHLQASKSNAKPSSPSPLVVTPRWERSLDFLRKFLRANRGWLDEKLAVHGAVLVRGFDLETASDLQIAIQSYNPRLSNTYRGTSPRNVLDKSAPFVFSAAEVPAHYPIAQHLEMSFLPEPPSQLYFGCLRPSRSSGGETALCDFRAVARDLSPDLQSKLLSKGIRYTRTHRRAGSRYTYDVSEMVGWQDLFGTSSKEEVERICRLEGTPVEWSGPGGDTFVSVTHSPAFQVHPVTGEPVWFNHSQVFHWTTFAAELWFAFCRTLEVRLFLHFVWIAVYSCVRYGLLGHKMSLQADFGDGTPITAREMGRIRSAIHRNMVFSRWQRGDLLLIDNFSTSHGRQPTYDGGRKIAVAWADPRRKADETVSMEALRGHADPPHACMENPQERTPDTTLTKDDAAALKEKVQAQEEALARALLAAEASDGLRSLFQRRGGEHHRHQHARSKSACY